MRKQKIRGPKVYVFKSLKGSKEIKIVYETYNSKFIDNSLDASQYQQKLSFKNCYGFDVSFTASQQLDIHEKVSCGSKRQ